LENNVKRLIDALRLKNGGRQPVTGLMTAVNVDLMEKSGVSWPEAHSDAYKMVTLAAAAFEFYGLESMKLPFDMAVEAEALGAAVDFGTKMTLPQVRKNLYDNPGEAVFNKGFLDNGRLPMVLRAIGEARKRYDGVIPVVSSIVGPFTLATALFGFENILTWMIEEPESLVSALEFTTKISIAYAAEQENAGSDVIQIGEAACSGDLISGDDYGKFIAPAHKILCSSIKIPSVVHICGNITSHLAHIKNTGMSCISMDAKTDISEAVKILKGNTAIAGYVPTLEVLRNGTPESVYKTSVDCIKAGVDVLNAGCAWPPDVPGENVRAMVSAAKEYVLLKSCCKG